MKIAITGAEGFLGWHLSCRLLANPDVYARRVARTQFATDEGLEAALEDVDVVIHLAGVNRAGTEDEVELGNVVLAERIAKALGGRPVHVVFANSVQSEANTPYGRGKRRASEILAALPGTLADVLLPNLFGEHGRPAYNSFVATFVHEVANDRQPSVTGDRSIPLLHAQDAAEALIAAAMVPESVELRPAGEPHAISEVLALLNDFHELYAGAGEIPNVSDPFRLNLFNTYRAARFPQGYPIHPQVHADPRGELIETGRIHGSTGQSYISSTAPGQVRGEHYHLQKIERFVVFRGEAEICLRRLFSHDVVRFRVGGGRPAIIDMPTMWVHNLRNVGDDEVVTVFWSNQLLDPANPDQFPMKVEEA